MWYWHRSWHKPLQRKGPDAARLCKSELNIGIDSITTSRDTPACWRDHRNNFTTTSTNTITGKVKDPKLPNKTTEEKREIGRNTSERGSSEEHKSHEESQIIHKSQVSEEHKSNQILYLASNYTLLNNVYCMVYRSLQTQIWLLIKTALVRRLTSNDNIQYCCSGENNKKINELSSGVTGSLLRNKYH